jgi:hypothetical protein
MSVDSLIEQLRANGDHELFPTASTVDVAKTEEAIGRRLPDSYRRFVSEFSNGAYLFGVQEISAVGDGNDQIVAIQNGVRLGQARAEDMISGRRVIPLATGISSRSEATPTATNGASSPVLLLATVSTKSPISTRAG